MDFTDDGWEFESFEDGYDGNYDEREYVEDDTEDSADWPDDLCGEDE